MEKGEVVTISLSGEKVNTEEVLNLLKREFPQLQTKVWAKKRKHSIQMELDLK